MRKKLSTEELHRLLLSSLDGRVRHHSDIRKKPLDIELQGPLPPRVRVYMYNATSPPGGRTLGEHKIQLIVPGQRPGQVCGFDQSDARYILLVGYNRDTNTFILWDADMYPAFTYSRNVQVNPETVYTAVAGKIGYQERNIRGQGRETVLTASPERLVQAIKERVTISRRRLLGE